MFKLTFSQFLVLVFHVEEMELEHDQAEHEMMEFGLAQSSMGLDNRSSSPRLEFLRKPSVFFASTLDLLGKSPGEPPQPEKETEEAPVVDNLPEIAAVSLPDPDNLRPPNLIAISSKTVLMLPFSFWPNEDKEEPSFLAKG